MRHYVWLIVFVLCIAPMVAAQALVDYTSYFHGHRTYLDNRIQPVVVDGTSMAPAFQTGDILLAVPFPFENLRLGDIIIWESQGQLVAHRIYEISGASMWTKGDNMPAPDEIPVTKESYRGLVIGVLFTGER